MVVEICEGRIYSLSKLFGVHIARRSANSGDGDARRSTVPWLAVTQEIAAFRTNRDTSGARAIGGGDIYIYRREEVTEREGAERMTRGKQEKKKEENKLAFRI
ncbi:hypothetical protein L484_009103 [Morus notabilis]|uniref:Uncharacterized protein n=1 Tax=Morus notabilis TaxID=981085 RepID=W9QQW3_9ROSA|nr:hypothetical protein L484_009103 [Morus notabilis]